METSVHRVSFLDTQVIKEGRVLYTDLYTKPTDTHDYLLYESSHPKACKDSIPYSQFLRIRRICSRIEDFDLHVDKLLLHFKRRHYPAPLLEAARDLARGKERSELLHPQPKETSDCASQRVFLITTYHPSDRGLVDVVRRNWELLGRSRNTRHLFEKKMGWGIEDQKI